MSNANGRAGVNVSSDVFEYVKRPAISGVIFTTDCALTSPINDRSITGVASSITIAVGR